MNAYEVITERIVKLIEQGTCPWRMPWSQIEIATQRNGVSDAAYNGINQFLMFMTSYSMGYTSPYWLTYKQAQEIGGQVRKGEKGTPVIRFGQYTRESDDGEAVSGAFLKQYTVFNAAQIDGLDDDKYKPAVVIARDSVERIAACEAIVENFADKPEIKHGGGRAFYRPSEDFVQVPEQVSFTDDESYYNVLFHELGHSTGHADRLARKGVTDPTQFGSHAYSQEELVAEFTAAFLCQSAGIDSATIDQSASYLASWLKAFKSDPKMLIVAAGQAQKAADMILGKLSAVTA